LSLTWHRAETAKFAGSQGKTMHGVEIISGAQEALRAAVAAASNVQEACEAIRKYYDVHVVYHLAQTPDTGRDAPFVKTTYPTAWVGHYVLNGYVNIDPVVHEGFQRVLPFDWSELSVATLQVERLFRDAIRFGLGASGYSVPLTDKAGRRALFSINGMMVRPAWHDFVRANRGCLTDLAQILHRRALVEVYGEGDAAQRLAPREIECLAWVAQGKEAPQIAVILGLSAHTVRAYLKSVRHKLNCTSISQAVDRARQLRILAPPSTGGTQVRQ